MVWIHLGPLHANRSSFFAVQSGSGKCGLNAYRSLYDLPEPPLNGYLLCSRQTGSWFILKVCGRSRFGPKTKRSPVSLQPTAAQEAADQVGAPAEFWHAGA